MKLRNMLIVAVAILMASADWLPAYGFVIVRGYYDRPYYGGYYGRPYYRRHYGGYYGRPYAREVWISGHYIWRNGYRFWVPGHWR